jgi:hypothetical protein
MLAEPDHFPTTLPPGFSFVEGEPEFDASKHLAVEKPERVVALAELGYSDEEIGQYPSPIAATTPVRILSEAGVQALQQAIDLTMPRMVPTSAGDPRLYYGSYHSKFMRDLTFAPELTDFMSEIFETPIAAHTMGCLGVQCNIGMKPQVEIQPWHHDRVSFSLVLSMYDPAKVKGGRFEWFQGTREEGKRLWVEEGEVPADRTVAPELPAGYAAIVQGPAVYHRGAPLLSEGYRASFVLSFCHRDASYPDLNDNRTFFTDDRPRLGIESDIDPSFTEWARHNAWLARARLGSLMEELPWTNDLAFIIEQLRQAVEPIELAIERLERGVISAEEAQAYKDSDYQARENQLQMSTPRFAPGAYRPLAKA